MFKTKTTLDWVALIVTVIGAFNWFLVGTLDFDLVTFIFGRWELVTRIAYSLIGLAGVYLLYAVAKPSGRPAMLMSQPPVPPQPPLQ